MALAGRTHREFALRIDLWSIVVVDSIQLPIDDDEWEVAIFPLSG